MLNISKQFSERIFTNEELLKQFLINGGYSKDTNILKIFNKNSKKAEATQNSEHYDLADTNKQMQYVDASIIMTNNKMVFNNNINNNNNNTNNNNNLSTNKEAINTLFHLIDDKKLLYDIFNAMLVSPKYCHMVINNQFVLTQMHDFFKSKLIIIYKYLIGYAWLTMYQSECFVGTNTTKDHSFVFNINTANKLPFFPYCNNCIHDNPYCSLLVNEHIIKTNIYQGLAMIDNYNQYGIDNLDGFKKKFNIFTSGRVDKDIFEGLDWVSFAVTGSIITACVPKKNPLVNLMANKEIAFDVLMKKFYQEYYENSDIDIMCNTKSIYDYINNVSKLIDVVEKNIGDKLTITSNKSLCITIDKKYIELEMKQFGTVDEVIKKINDVHIQEYLYNKYIYSIKNRQHTQNTQNTQQPQLNDNTLFNDYFNKISPIDNMYIVINSHELTESANNQYNNDTDINIYLNDILLDKVHEDQNIMVFKISESIKFKLSSPVLPRSIEIFRINCEDFFGCVSKFHLPCVRGYYDGNMVYLLPSCITALMTFLNIDYKYFAGSRDPIAIINKYIQRGFGIAINQEEYRIVKEYNDIDEDFKKRFANSNYYFTSKKITDEVFKNSKYIKGESEDYYSKNRYRYITFKEELYNYYQKTYKYTPKKINYLLFNAIDETGFVYPLEKGILDAAYNELSI